MASAINPPKKISRRHELRQDTVVTAYARSYGFFEENRGLVIGIGVGVVVLIAAILGYVYYQNQRADEAQVLLSEVLPAYEAGRFQEALDGASGDGGLLYLADAYGGTPAGNLAAFYAADSHYNLGNYEAARDFFLDFDGDDSIIAASALAGAAMANENLGAYEEAGDLFLRAVGVYPDELTAPRYLMGAGRAYEEAGALDDAQAAYERVLNEYPDAQVAGDVELRLARVAARTTS